MLSVGSEELQGLNHVALALFNPAADHFFVRLDVLVLPVADQVAPKQLSWAENARILEQIEWLLVGGLLTLEKNDFFETLRLLS